MLGRIPSGLWTSRLYLFIYLFVYVSYFILFLSFVWWGILSISTECPWMKEHLEPGWWFCHYTCITQWQDAVVIITLFSGVWVDCFSWCYSARLIKSLVTSRIPSQSNQYLLINSASLSLPVVFLPGYSLYTVTVFVVVWLFWQKTYKLTIWGKLGCCKMSFYLCKAEPEVVLIVIHSYQSMLFCDLTY